MLYYFMYIYIYIICMYYIYCPARSWFKTWAVGGGGARQGAGKWRQGRAEIKV